MSQGLQIEEPSVERRLDLLEERLNRTWVPLWPSLFGLIAALTVATALLVAIALPDVLATARRYPLWAALLAGMLLAASLGAAIAMRAASRIGEDGERLRLYADDLIRRLRED